MKTKLESITKNDTFDPDCSVCLGEGWVCENHPDKPWNGGDPECCGGAGSPCRCNGLGNPERTLQ